MVEKKGKKDVATETEKVTRITADDKKIPKKRVAIKKSRKTSKFLSIFIRIGGYFVGAWRELREVRWPTRSATWALTFAVIMFSLVFAVIILLLDSLFKLLFEMIIK